MKFLKTTLIAALLIGTASIAFSNDFDWSRFRRQVQNCAQNDAHCVGQTMINIMQEVHGSGGTPGQVEIKCACGNEFQTRNTVGDMSLDICAKCHPFFTGKQKLIDTAGRVDKFLRKYKIEKKNA